MKNRSSIISSDMWLYENLDVTLQLAKANTLLLNGSHRVEERHHAKDMYVQKLRLNYAHGINKEKRRHCKDMRNQNCCVANHSLVMALPAP